MITRTRAIAQGMFALLAIIAVLVGIPAALWFFGGNPLPTDVPSLEEVTTSLTQPDDGSLFIRALMWVGWIGWASMAFSILVQAGAALRGVKAPSLPGMGWQQRRAAVLTTAVAAMFAVGPAVTTASAAPAATAPAVTQSTASAQAAAPGPTASSESTHSSTTRTSPVVVEQGDTLWQIADDELGDPSRYPEIAERNSIDDPDVIQAGQRLKIPPTAQEHHSPTPSSTDSAAPQERSTPESPHADSNAPSAQSSTKQEAAGSKAPSTAAPEPSTAAPTSSGATAPFGGAGPDAAPRASSAAPSAADGSGSDTPRPAQTRPTHAAPETAPATAHEDSEADSAPLPLILSLGGLSLLAASGSLALLDRRRKRKAREREPGQRPASPSERSADVESALRSGDDPMAVSDLDAALRTLTALTTVENGPSTVPSVRAALIADDVIELYLVDADATLPAPFTNAGDGAWVLQRSDREQLLTHEESLAYAPPCPALVSLGRDEDNGLLMLNLEQAGTLGITGDSQVTREIMTALAIELIGAAWADSSRVTLVGMLPELVDALESDRANYAEDIDQVLAGMEYAATVHRNALAQSDLEDVDQARAQGVHDESWTPHLVLVDTELSPEQHRRLAELVKTVPRVAVAAVTSAQPVGEWVMRTHLLPTGEVVADLDPHGLSIVPQRLAQDVYDDMLALYRTADEPDVAGPEWARNITDGSVPDLDEIPLPVDDNVTEPAEEEDDAVLTDTEIDTNTASTTKDTSVAEPSPPSAPADDNASVDDDELHVDEQDLQDVSGDEDQVVDEVDHMPASSTVDAEPVAPQRPALRGLSRISTAPERDSDAAPAVDVTPLQLPEGPMLRLLGEKVTLDNPAGKSPQAPGRAVEVLAYLALHPGHDEKAFTEAIFPNKLYVEHIGKMRNNYMDFTRNWVGRASDGHPYVAYVDEGAGGYRLAEDMPTDWGIFQSLVGHDIAEASTQDLIAALSLVTGAPMSRIPVSKAPAKRYEWANSDITEIRRSVADVAHELSSRAARAGSPRLAMEAAMKGLWAEPLMEALWRDKITAAWATGQPTRALEIVAECQNVLDQDRDLSEATQDLIRQIHDHTTRPHAVA